MTSEGIQRISLSSRTAPMPPRIDLVKRLREFASISNERLPDFTGSIGLEARLAWRLWERSGSPDDSSLRTMFLRPNREAILATYLPAVVRNGFDAQLYADLGSVLSGARQSIRTKPFAQTTPFNGQRLVYDDGVDAQSRCAELLATAHALRQGAEFFDVLKLFAELVLAQSLGNANARAACGVFNLLLVTNGWLRAPSLSTAPTFISDPSASFEAWKAVGSGRWEPWLHMFERALDDTINLFQETVATPPPPTPHHRPCG